jgi:hypothetical protein
MRDTGMAVPAMHDRFAGANASAAHRSQTQAGFITVLVLPLWSALASAPFARVVDTAAIVASLKANLASHLKVIDDEQRSAAEIVGAE